MAKSPAPQDIADLRKDIDRVDEALLGLIADRLELAKAVRDAKSGTRVWRPSREESLIRRLAERAQHTSPHLVSRIWAELVSASLALQGPIKLHIALEGDAVEVWSLVRDRFGAAIPALSYPTASSALAAAYADPEGVAVLSAPGGMNTWWSALCSDGAMPDMHVLAGLPRVGPDVWPKAVAVSSVDFEPLPTDTLLIAMANTEPLHALGIKATLRAEAGHRKLVTVENGLSEDQIAALKTGDPEARIIGCLAHPLPES